MSEFSPGFYVVCVWSGVTCEGREAQEKKKEGKGKEKEKRKEEEKEKEKKKKRDNGERAE